MVSVPRRGFIVFLPIVRLAVESYLDIKFQSPEGDSLFFYLSIGQVLTLPDCWFQSPEGDSLFFYQERYAYELPLTELRRVSVPRRGFIVFLRQLAGVV